MKIHGWRRQCLILQSIRAFENFLIFWPMHIGLALLPNPDASLATMPDPNIVAILKHGCQTKTLGSDVFIRPKAFGSEMVDRPKTRVLNGCQPTMLLAWLQQSSQTQDTKVAKKKQWLRRKKSQRNVS